jgi:hypothetical protein
MKLQRGKVQWILMEESEQMILLKKVTAVTAISGAVVLGTMIATPTAIAAPDGKLGAVMTKTEMSALGCEKGGNNGSIGWARCNSTHAFKVRVWCTWAGQGLSDDWRSPYNWAQCDRGSVHSEDDGIEIIWQ